MSSHLPLMLPPWRSALLAGAMLAFLLLPAGAADRSATPATFTSVFAAAQAGDRVLLASGGYGTFTGGTKSGIVTIRPQDGATVTMEVAFAPASNINIDGVTMSGMGVSGASRNLTFTNIVFTGQVTFRDATGPMNVLFDHCHWGAIDSIGYYEGRLSTVGSVTGPCGITVQNSRFGPGGNLDGIQTGVDGLRILNNEFVGIRAGSSGIHTDAIQLYGSRNTLVRGNWIHDCDSGIMAPDGTDHETIEDNVIDIDYPYALMIGSDDGSTIRHNTLRPHDVDFFGPNAAGVVVLGSKSGQPVGHGTIVSDNIVQAVTVQSGLATAATNDYNLVRGSGAVSGPHDIAGIATFVGGGSPSTWAGYRLASASPGRNAASDGTDMGARSFGDLIPDDTVAPSVPANLGATAISATQITLTWNAASDNAGGSGLAGYQILRGGAQVATVTAGTTWTDSGLGASTTYTYAVAAYDHAAPANVSAPSASAMATTQANHAPVANAQSVAVTLNTPKAITLAATDVDAGDTRTYAIVSQPLHGTLSGAGGTVTYTPATGYLGPDGFTFRATDNHGAVSASATAAITVAAAPAGGTGSTGGSGSHHCGAGGVAALIACLGLLFLRGLPGVGDPRP